MQRRVASLKSLKQFGGRSQPLSFKLQTGLSFNKDFQTVLLLTEGPLVRQVLRLQSGPDQRDRHDQSQRCAESKEHGKTHGKDAGETKTLASAMRSQPDRLHVIV